MLGVPLPEIEKLTKLIPGTPRHDAEARHGFGAGTVGTGQDQPADCAGDDLRAEAGGHVPQTPAATRPV